MEEFTGNQVGFSEMGDRSADDNKFELAYFPVPLLLPARKGAECTFTLAFSSGVGRFWWGRSGD